MEDSLITNMGTAKVWPKEDVARARDLYRKGATVKELKAIFKCGWYAIKVRIDKDVVDEAATIHAAPTAEVTVVKATPKKDQEVYVPAKWSAPRQGADKFLTIRSKGI